MSGDKGTEPRVVDDIVSPPGTLGACVAVVRMGTGAKKGEHAPTDVGELPLNCGAAAALIASRMNKTKSLKPASPTRGST